MNTSQRAARSILALAGIEARRHLRNPILWLGTCATIGQAAGPYADGQGPLPDPWVTEDYEGFLSAWGWLFLAAFVTAVVTVNRHLEPRTAQLFAGQPTDAGQRMIALLLAGVVPAGLAGLAAGATCAVVARAGGIATGFSLNMVPTVTSVYLVPTVAEAAVAVAIVAVGYTFGVACALNISSLIANLIPGVLFAFAGIGMFWIWVYPVSVFSPFATPLSHTDLGPAPTEDVKAQWQILHPPADAEHMPHWYGYVRDTDMIAWHAIYLTGIVLLLSAYAIRRAGGRALRWLASAGLLLVAGGATMQILTHSGAGN